MWTGAGYALWALVVAGALWLGAKVLRGWWDREFGLGTGIVSLLALAAGGATLYGLGLVASALPGMAETGLVPPEWLSDVDWAKPAIMIMGLWMGIGGSNMLLYIAGISNIPQELYEAADIDGAGRWQRFWHVTWPQLAPTTFFIVVMSVIGGLQGGFEQARTMTKGGPDGATTTLSYFVYIEGFETGRLGYASAVAWAMFVMIFALTLLNYRFGNRYVND
jgi:multiple sugar transport system permease protein